MEKVSSDQQVVSGSGSGSVSVSLHPLVVMNVSDHYTRVKVQENVPDLRGN
jgi:COP9 signalosome complex subunit 6